jgi:hypothetical protein
MGLPENAVGDSLESTSERPVSQTHMETHENDSMPSPAVRSANAATDNVPTQEDWRVLARLIQNEREAGKMAELVQHLITRFDEEKLRGA